MPNTHAAICRLGDVVSRDVEQDAPPARCPRCGVTVYRRCVGCSTPIPGPSYALVQGAAPLTLVRRYEVEYEPPERCERCRVPHPWAKLLRGARERHAA